MALPDGVLSTSPVPASFVGGASLPAHNWLCHEQGGYALNDTTEGLLYQTWKAEIVANPETGLDDVWVSAENLAPYVEHSAAGITEISISFDRNMNLHYAFVENGESKLRWYDSVAQDMVTTNFGSTYITPRLTHDDKRDNQSAISDIIMAYLRDGNLYYRQQRDRFQVEYLLQSNVDSPGIVKVGMNSQLRLQFMMKHA